MAEQKIFYFSGTGNSLYVAGRLDEAPLSIPQEMRKPAQLCRRGHRHRLLAARP